MNDISDHIEDKNDDKKTFSEIIYGDVCKIGRIAANMAVGAGYGAVTPFAVVSGVKKLYKPTSPDKMFDLEEIGRFGAHVSVAVFSGISILAYASQNNNLKETVGVLLLTNTIDYLHDVYRRSKKN